MHAARPSSAQFCRVLLATAVGLVCASSALATEPSVGVAVLHTVPWSPNDSTRDGAGEFAVLLRVAQLRRAHAAAGLVSVGDHNGTLQCGGERALRRVALTGVPVVKLARGGDVAATPDGLFLDAGRLSEDQAVNVLTRCLTLYGAPPPAANPDKPSARELAGIRAHLRSFRSLLAISASQQVAVAN